jgi:hypothetical protein
MLSAAENNNGRILNSLPYYGSNGGIIGSQENGHMLPLYEAYLEHGRKNHCHSSTLISSPIDSIEVQAWYEANSKYNFKDVRIGQITSLPEDIATFEEFVRVDCHLMVRRAINKAKKHNISIEISGKNGMEFLRNTHLANMAKLGGIPKSSEFFNLVPKFFNESEDYQIFTAKYNGEPIAALLLFYFNETVEYFTPVIDERFRAIQPLSLIIEFAMKNAILRDFKKWNWGGTWLNQNGVFDFKNRWGAKSHHYYYFTHLFNDLLIKKDKATLLMEYPNFYLIPFSELEK